MFKSPAFHTSSHGHGSRGTGPHSAYTAALCQGPFPPAENTEQTHFSSHHFPWSTIQCFWNQEGLKQHTELVRQGCRNISVVLQGCVACPPKPRAESGLNSYITAVLSNLKEKSAVVKLAVIWIRMAADWQEYITTKVISLKTITGKGDKEQGQRAKYSSKVGIPNCMLRLW